jgi:hypothetical protein
MSDVEEDTFGTTAPQVRPLYPLTRRSEVRIRGQTEKHLLTSGHSISKPLQAASGRLARRQAFQASRMTTWISSIRLNNEISRYKRSRAPLGGFFCSAGCSPKLFAARKGKSRKTCLDSAAVELIREITQQQPLN